MIDSEIEDFLAAELLERGLARNTVEAYRSDLALFSSYLGRQGVVSAADIVREHISGFLGAERELGHAARTRSRRSAAIRMFLRFLRERKRIAENPSELMDTPKKGLVLPRVLSEAEIAAMLDAVSGEDPRSLRDRALLETLYGCGLRVSEACSLMLEHIVADGELLRILGKGSKERLVPIGRGAGRALGAYLEGGRGSFTRGDLSENHVFVTRLGHPFTRQGVFKLIRERAAAVGIAADRISPHVLRHSYASHMLAHGADIRTIQELLGHSDIGTTQIYTHVDTAAFSELHRKYHPRGEGEAEPWPVKR